MIYFPDTPPTDPEALPQYLMDEFQRMAVALTEEFVATGEQLLSVQHRYNRDVKRVGLRVMVSDTNKQVYASGKNPTDDWVYEDGTVAFSPE